MAEEKKSEKKPNGPKRVLIVDDDNEIVESVRFALEQRGYQVLVARDGNQGLAMAEREDPDLVILDMMMPKRSGFLVLEKLRRTRPVPLRVIMITANEGSRHKAYAEMLGVDDYIRKPFAMDRLMESVTRLLEAELGGRRGCPGFSPSAFRCHANFVQTLYQYFSHRQISRKPCHQMVCMKNQLFMGLTLAIWRKIAIVANVSRDDTSNWKRLARGSC